MADSPDHQSTPATAGRSGVRARTVVIVIAAIVLGLGIAWFFASRNQDEGTPAVFLKADKVGEPVRSIGPLKGANLQKYASSRQKALGPASEPVVSVVWSDRAMPSR